MVQRGPSPKGERLFRRLLRLYPAHVREDADFEPRMLDGFRFLRESGLEGVRLWWHVGRDLGQSIWNERFDPIGPHQGGAAPRGSGGGMMGWIDDLGYAARRLVRSPGFTGIALTILVFGIGVNTTAFSVVNALLFQRPPFEEPEALVLVLQDSDGGEPTSTSYPAYEDISGYSIFESVSAFYTDQGFMGEAGEALAPVLLEYATASYMHVLGLSPVRGTWFDDSHDDPAGDPVAVLTYRMWSDRLGADPDVIGRTLRINGGLVTVIGIGPPEFNGGRGPAAVDLWLSISAMDATGGRVASLERRQDHPMTVRARLADGVPLVAAREAMDGLAAELAATYPEINEGREITVLPVLDVRVSPTVDAEIVPAASFAMAVVVLVLVIGTLNLANLLLVRSSARAREIAVRLALGAGRLRVVRVVLSEALLLAAVGGVGGYLLAGLVAREIRNSRFDFVLPLQLDLRLDLNVVLFTVVMALMTGLIFGLLPALRATRRDVNATLRDDASSGIGAKRRFGLTGALVSGQVAVSVMLLALAGVFVDSFAKARGADSGFAHERTAYVQVNTSMTGLEGQANLDLIAQLEERLGALPMVQGVTSSLMLPAAQFGTTTLLLGAEVDGADRPTEIPWNFVTEDFFSVLGLELIDGRLFEAADFETTVAIVSEAFAMTYFGRADIAGRSYRSEGSPDEPVEIVGVVSNATVRALGESPTPSIYWPLNFPLARSNLVFAYEGEAAAALGAAQDAIRGADGRIMILGAESMEDHLGETLTQQRLVGVLLTALGGLALLLAILGVYGVVSFAVSRRRQEVGVRIALGAARDAVVRLFVRDVAAVVIVGAVLGVALAVPASFASAQAFTGTGGGVLMSAGAAVVLLLTSLGATIVPALRATHTDPTEALRQD